MHMFIYMKYSFSFLLKIMTSNTCFEMYNVLKIQNTEILLCFAILCPQTKLQLDKDLSESLKRSVSTCIFL